MSAAASLAFAARYVSRHLWQSLLLALAIGLVLALPAAVRVFTKTLEREMRARAVATPQVIGAKGSALDLMLAALHFRRQPLEPVKLGQTDSVARSGMASVIPLHVRFHSLGSPIVGTTLDYFSFRGSQMRDGHLFRRLGDCVIGARIARDRKLKPGDFLFSTSEQVFDIAGEYPLKMRVAGVLAESGTPDDHAIFCDLKTTWLIEGRAHGHDDLTEAAASDILKQENGNVVGSAAVKMFKEVTDQNSTASTFTAISPTTRSQRRSLSPWMPVLRPSSRAATSARKTACNSSAPWMNSVCCSRHFFRSRARPSPLSC
jgi:putative ABC transport system permease protein